MVWFVANQKRDFFGRRWVSIVLRTLHLVGVAGVAGGYIYNLPNDLWLNYLWLVLATGFGMMIKELYVDRIWLIQLRGAVIVLKLILLLIGQFWFTELDTTFYMLVIIISGLIAHAPGKIRYYSLWHQRRYTRDDWLKEKQQG